MFICLCEKKSSSQTVLRSSEYRFTASLITLHTPENPNNNSSNNFLNGNIYADDKLLVASCTFLITPLISWAHGCKKCDELVGAHSKPTEKSHIEISNLPLGKSMTSK